MAPDLSLTRIGCRADAVNTDRTYASAFAKSGSSSGKSMVPATDRMAVGSVRPPSRASSTIRSRTALRLPRDVAAACARSQRRLSASSVIDTAFRIFIGYHIIRAHGHGTRGILRPATEPFSPTVQATVECGGTLTAWKPWPVTAVQVRASSRDRSHPEGPTATHVSRNSGT